MVGRIICLLAAVCAIHLGGVAAQPGLPDLGDELGELGDLLDQLDLGDFDVIDEEGTATPVPMEAVTAQPLTCYECGTSAELDKNNLERSCAKPSKGTVNGTLCHPTVPGVVNHCGWMEATVSTANPDNPEENMELYWIFRGCVPVPATFEIADKCFADADLVGTLNDLGMPLTEIVGASKSSNITGKGCFCGEDYCNGASMMRALPLSVMLVVVAAINASLF